MSPITAITRKMPKPIPALKILAIASHELKMVEISRRKNALIIFEFFMDEMF